MTDENGPSTREKILVAASTMLGEDSTTRLSVRAVAARAGVSTGSLRHFFPTQRDLLDAVMAGIYAVGVADDPIRDLALPPRERLLACLQHLLAQVGGEDGGRSYWRSAFRAYVETEPSAESAEVYLALEREGLRRVEGWLDVLANERGDTRRDAAADARFLTAVVDGIAIERAMPGAAARQPGEVAILRAAVAAVMPDA
jgi:AcrR family transcriptional regulator